MKDYTKEELETSEPDVEVLDGIEFCLKKFYDDKEHSILDEVVNSLTFEELIGILILCKEEIKILTNIIEDNVHWSY